MNINRQILTVNTFEVHSINSFTALFTSLYGTLFDIEFNDRDNSELEPDGFLPLNWQKSGFVRSGRTGPSSATIVSSKRSFRIDKSFIFETNKKFSIENIIFQTILLTMLIICAIFLHTCYSSVAKIIIIQN